MVNLAMKTAGSGRLLRRFVRWLTFADSGFQHLAQVRRILMAMDRHGVLHGGVQQLPLAVGDQRHRAIHFRGKLAAIDIFARYGSSHGPLPGSLLRPARCKTALAAWPFWGEASAGPDKRRRLSGLEESVRGFSGRLAVHARFLEAGDLAPQQFDALVEFADRHGVQR